MAFFVVLELLAFPCFVVGLLALPLCGAAPTFFAAAKKVGKEDSFKPPAHKRVPRSAGGSGASGIRAPAHSALVTTQSSFRRRCARRNPVPKPSVGSPGRPVRDARSAEWERMTALSPRWNVRGHRLQMHHCLTQTEGPAYELAV
ncbi:hypothetical protein F6X42_01950 [Paraburkholderia sp. WC7.3b]|uniref:Secreted protein n=1 Tax=Paraburkholderia podalyriae TaxID=1938811 RepID=A0ABR7PGD0_9BURK|nr:hypothetical protein [Paraburkholderia podalyriae]